MNKTKTNEFMEALNNQYVQATENHKRAIKNYMNGLLSDHAYRELDGIYTLKEETIRQTIHVFLHIKNRKDDN